MKLSIEQGKASNYQVSFTLTPEDFTKNKDKALQSFQKDMDVPGFRKGHVPLSMVESRIQPQYITMTILENAITDSMKTLLDQHKDKQFIGQPYNIDQKQEKENTVVTYSIDVFPQVQVANKKREKISTKALEVTLEHEEIDKALDSIRRQHASYEDVDTMSEDTITKLKFRILDKEGKEIDKGSVYVGKEEYDEFAWFTKHLIGHKKGLIDPIKYSKDVPAVIKVKDEEAKPDTIQFEVIDIKRSVLPDLNDPKTLKKIFPEEPVFHNEGDVVAKITEVLADHKQKESLVALIEDLLTEAHESLEVTIPQTIVEQELESRLKRVQENFGGKDAMEHYLKTIGEEKAKTMVDELRDAATKSLEKYFSFQKLTELFEVKDINRNAELDAEIKFYEKVTGKKFADVKVTVDHHDHHHNHDEKKTPAKKK